MHTLHFKPVVLEHGLEALPSKLGVRELISVNCFVVSNLRGTARILNFDYTLFLCRGTAAAREGRSVHVLMSSYFCLV